MFGGGNDIRIWEGTRSDNYSNLGHTYELPPGIKEDKGKTYLSGSEKFKVK